MKLELSIPDTLRKVFFSCETFCVAGCCGLNAFDVDAQIIYQSFQRLPEGEPLQQLDALIAEISVHDGPVLSGGDFYHEWARASDCVDYLKAWRGEFVRALAGDLDPTGSPKERLAEARTHGRYALSLEVARLRSELPSQPEDRASETRSAIAELDDDEPLIREEVLAARQNLAERGVLRYTAARHPPCPHCGKPLRTPTAKQCRFCGRDWH
jgi:hypothetical protein